MVREHDDSLPRRSSVSSPPTRNSSNQWHFSVLRAGGAVQCIISRSTSREWDPDDARLRRKIWKFGYGPRYPRLSYPLPLGLSTPAGGSKAPQGEFLNSFSRAVCARHSRYLRSCLSLLPDTLPPPATRVPLSILPVVSRWFTDFQSVETGPFKFNGVTGIFPPSISSVNKLNLHI